MREAETQPESGQICSVLLIWREKKNICDLNRKPRPLPDMLGLNLGMLESVTEVHLPCDSSLFYFKGKMSRKLTLLDTYTQKTSARKASPQRMEGVEEPVVERC